VCRKEYRNRFRWRFGNQTAASHVTPRGGDVAAPMPPAGTRAAAPAAAAAATVATSAVGRAGQTARRRTHWLPRVVRCRCCAGCGFFTADRFPHRTTDNAPESFPCAICAARRDVLRVEHLRALARARGWRFVTFFDDRREFSTCRKATKNKCIAEVVQSAAAAGGRVNGVMIVDSASRIGAAVHPFRGNR
jgi:hypothetical protein